VGLGVGMDVVKKRTNLVYNGNRTPALRPVAMRTKLYVHLLIFLFIFNHKYILFVGNIVAFFIMSQYCHVFLVTWLIIMGSGLDESIY
jgi:hypothetical protein